MRAATAPMLRAGFAADCDFHEQRGPPGGTSEVLWMHHLVNGVVLDAITVPLDPARSPREVAEEAVRAMLG